jgi:hypothetical protein
VCAREALLSQYGILYYLELTKLANTDRAAKKQ